MRLRQSVIRAEKPELSELSNSVKAQVETEIKYDGYIRRQQADEKRFRRMEETLLPADADYLNMVGLRIEARQKLDRQKPVSLGAAGRIPGVNPADVAVLQVWLHKQKEMNKE